MSTTSTPNDLTSRLRQRMETDRRQIEETAARELERLGESLNAVASGALRSIEADTAEATERMRALLLRAWLRPLVVGLSLFLGICGGSWVTMPWLSRSIDYRIETLAEVSVRIERARETLAEMEETTWGVTLREISGEQYVALPAGTPGPSVLHHGRTALHEAVERVRELHDRVGTAVDGGLGEVVRAVRDRTAAALRASRKPLRQQVEALQRQVERLSEQVTHLTEYYGTFGAGSRGRWI